MAFKASHRFARISARKVRPLADLIRGKAVDDALAILRYQPQRGARMLEKLIKSALGNAEDQRAPNVGGLVVKDARVDEMHGLADRAPQTARDLAGQIGKQVVEQPPGPLRIRIRKRRPCRHLAAQVVELARVARQPSFDFAQALGPGQLRVDQRDQLALRRQRADVLVGTVFIHKPGEAAPRHMLQHRVEYAILMQHGVASFRVLIVGKTSKPRRIHVMRQVHQN